MKAPSTTTAGRQRPTDKQVAEAAAAGHFLIRKVGGISTFIPTEQMSQQELDATYEERYSSGDLTADEMSAA